MTQRFLITMLLLYLNMLMTLQQCLLLVINVIRLLTLWGQFMTWPKENNMPCNPKKCKERIFRSKGNNSQYNPVFDISKCSSLVLLRVTIQSDCKFRAHVNLKLIKANKCLHVSRTLRKEQYSPAEIDHLLTVLVSPKFYLWRFTRIWSF